MDYPERINAACRQDASNVSQALYNVMNEPLIFNREVFGNIFAKKKKIEACLRSI